MDVDMEDCSKWRLCICCPSSLSIQVFELHYRYLLVQSTLNGNMYFLQLVQGVPYVSHNITSDHWQSIGIHSCSSLVPICSLCSNSIVPYHSLLVSFFNLINYKAFTVNSNCQYLQEDMRMVVDSRPDSDSKYNMVNMIDTLYTRSFMLLNLLWFLNLKPGLSTRLTVTKFVLEVVNWC